MKFIYALAIPIFLNLSAFGAPRDSEGALAIARQVEAASGGRAAFEAMTKLDFDWSVEIKDKVAVKNSYTWNPHTKEVTFEGMDGNSKLRVDFSNIDNKEGKVLLDGKPVAQDQKDALINSAYAHFINDSYWLIMPLKLFDPGVHLALMKPEKKEGKIYQVLHMEFENVGLTPKDQYWLFMNPETHLIDGWRFILTGGKKGEFKWKEYRKVGPLTLSTYRPSADGSKSIKININQ
jgi:hypothetical protein